MNMPIRGSQSSLLTKSESTTSSKPVQFAKDNKMLTVLTLGSSAILAKQATDKLGVTDKVIQKGVIPAIGIGAAAFGGKLIHDGITSWKKGEKISGDNNLNQVVKITGGAALATIGVETVGRSLEVKALQPLYHLSTRSAGVGTAYGFLGTVSATSLYGTYKLGEHAVENGLNPLNSLGLTVTSAIGLGTGGMIGNHALGFNRTVEKVAMKGYGGVIGLGLGATAITSGKYAYEQAVQGNTGMAVFAGGASALTGAGSLVLMADVVGGGKATEFAIEALFNKKVLAVAAASVVALGVATYLSADDEAK